MDCGEGCKEPTPLSALSPLLDSFNDCTPWGGGIVNINYCRLSVLLSVVLSSVVVLLVVVLLLVLLVVVVLIVVCLLVEFLYISLYFYDILCGFHTIQ